MTERLRSGNSFVNSANISAKMSNDLTPRKTMLILVIVVGCFAVLWPKVFYPMLVGSANQHIKPSPIDKTTGCCDVISEIDVNTIKIMSELCRTIIKKDEDLPLTGREIVAKCQSAVLETCGIDISAVLQEQVRLGQSVKQILDEIRSLNGSLCLKYNFGVAPWTLGVPHRVTVKMPSSIIRQERPMHLRSELVHPAFRERGRAIPQPQVSTPRPTPRVVEGRPGPIPGMRPTLGGAGHVVPPPKQGTSSMGLIMPIYTIGIVIFFTYTVLKIIFKKQPEALYPPVEPDPNFRREVFESERSQAPKLTREGISSKLVVNAMSALLDEVDQEIESRRLASDIAEQNVVANGNVPQEEEQPSVKVLGMEMTASCEGGKKWSRPNSPVLPASSHAPQEPAEPPQEIFLEGALPAQSHLLVAESATEAEKTSSEEDPAVVLAGKMTLSVISLDSSENGTDESSNFDKKQERSSSNISDEFEKIEVEEQVANTEEPQNVIDSVQRLEEIRLLEQIQNEIKEIDEKNIITELESTTKPLQLLDTEFSENIGVDLSAINTDREFIEKEKDQLDSIDSLSLNAAKETATTESIIGRTEITEQQSESKSGKNDKEKKSDIGKETIVDDIIEASDKTEIVEENQENENQDNVETKNFVQDETLSSIQPDNINNEQDLQSIQTDSSKPRQEVEIPENLEISSEVPSNITEPLLLSNLSESLVSSGISESLPSSNVYELPPNDLSEPLISSNASESLSTSNISDILESNDVSFSNKVPEPEIDLQELCAKIDDEISSKNRESDTEEAKPKSVPPKSTENQSEVSESVASVISTSADEKDSFETLNAAISDLSSELRSGRDEKEEVIGRFDEELDNDEEEIEYEYEDSDNEVIDEEIRNVNRLDNELDDAGKLNGENQEHSKYGTTSSVTLAENDISDEEILEDEDVDVQEIIEYITDDEEEIEEVAQRTHANNTNHISDQPGVQ